MINQMSLDKVELVKFVSYDGKVYKFGSDIIEKWQDCFIKNITKPASYSVLLSHAHHYG